MLSDAIIAEVRRMYLRGASQPDLADYFRLPLAAVVSAIAGLEQVGLLRARGER